MKSFQLWETESLLIFGAAPGVSHERTRCDLYDLDDNS